MIEGMIVIDVTLSTTARRKSGFVSLLRDMVAASLAEPGCLTYRPAIALDDELSFHLLEIWESEAAYAAHREGSAMRRFRDGLPACGEIVSIVRRAGPLHPYDPAAA